VKVKDFCRTLVKSILSSAAPKPARTRSARRVGGGGCEPAAAAGCPPGDTDLLLLMPAP